MRLGAGARALSATWNDASRHQCIYRRMKGIHAAGFLAPNAMTTP